MVTPYTPSHATVASGGSVTFDGAGSGTNQAIIVSMAGDFDAEIFYEASDDGGTSWAQIAQMATDSGDVTFTADWHSQGNRLMVVSGERRIRVDNVDTADGVVAVDGDEI